MDAKEKPSKFKRFSNAFSKYARAKTGFRQICLGFVIKIVESALRKFAQITIGNNKVPEYNLRSKPWQ